MAGSLASAENKYRLSVLAEESVRFGAGPWNECFVPFSSFLLDYCNNKDIRYWDEFLFNVELSYTNTVETTIFWSRLIDSLCIGLQRFSSEFAPGNDFDSCRRQRRGNQTHQIWTTTRFALNTEMSELPEIPDAVVTMISASVA
jgi:hypothetical protein